MILPSTTFISWVFSSLPQSSFWRKISSDFPYPRNHYGKTLPLKNSFSLLISHTWPDWYLLLFVLSFYTESLEEKIMLLYMRGPDTKSQWSISALKLYASMTLWSFCNVFFYWIFYFLSMRLLHSGSLKLQIKFSLGIHSLR